MIKISKAPKGFLQPKWLMAVTFFFAGAFAGLLISYLWFNLSGSVLAQNGGHKNSAYSFLNPLLASDLNQAGLGHEQALQITLEGVFNQNRAKGLMQYGTLYFKDINPGLWVGINESGQFSPGRLLKIPLMIAYYKLAQNDPGVLKQLITYNPGDIPFSIPDALGPRGGTTLMPGRSYSAGELIERMIINSDNTATELLAQNIDPQTLNAVFSDLGIQNQTSAKNYFIGVKAYSLFYTQLYNSTYLDRDSSNRALDLLVRAPNVPGIGAGVPRDIPVANRFGARQLANKLYQMYDCGIVYYPEHPYVLCMTVDGKTLAGIAQVFKTVSAKVFAEIRYQYPQQNVDTTVTKPDTL